MGTHNLPPQPTSFVGRSEEISEVTNLLNDAGCRLLSLVGPGGIGKSRLALEVSANQVENFTHGVYFVTLQSIASAEILVSAIADVIGIHTAIRKSD